ncbi:DUF6266 family protein [Pedobacter frigoris]|uniref:DUF6266 family protein n=1 Tax=Pedobacter frigoris TaxID=2571272 RepID=UPI00292EED5E|nr:DUF6266 family protein [Pedobacter frigoris]
MGIQHLGAFGGFQGKAGALVGHRVNGQNVITGIPYPSTKPPTQLQINARLRFGLMVDFLRPINSLLRVGFKDVKKEKQSAFNAAFSENYGTISGVAPAYVISYDQVIISKGPLAPAYNPEVSTVVGAGIKFDWSALAVLDSGKPTDLVTVLVYNTVKNMFVGFMGVVPRSALTYTLDLPAEFAGDQVQCWISMASADGDLVSDSVFVGALTVVA